MSELEKDVKNYLVAKICWSPARINNADDWVFIKKSDLDLFMTCLVARPFLALKSRGEGSIYVGLIAVSFIEQVFYSTEHDDLLEEGDVDYIFDPKTQLHIDRLEDKAGEGRNE